MNLYTVQFSLEAGSKQTVSVRARNKMEAVTAAYAKIPSWRDKERVEGIKIAEDEGNETTAENYQ